MDQRLFGGYCFDVSTGKRGNFGKWLKRYRLWVVRAADPVTLKRLGSSRPEEDFDGRSLNIKTNHRFPTSQFSKMGIIESLPVITAFLRNLTWILAAWKEL